MADDLHLAELARKLYPYLAADFLSLKSGYTAATYSPTYQGGTAGGATTYSIQVGHYIRIGALVIAWGTVVWTAATGTGDARISLPLANESTGNNYGTGALRTTNVTFANSAPQMQIDPGNPYFTMESPLTNAVTARVQMEAAGNVLFVAAYSV